MTLKICDVQKQSQLRASLLRGDYEAMPHKCPFLLFSNMCSQISHLNQMFDYPLCSPPPSLGPSETAVPLWPPQEDTAGPEYQTIL